MTIDEAIDLCESMAEKDIKELPPKDRLNFWMNIKEFREAKIQRIPWIPDEKEEEDEIKIIYVRNESSTGDN